MAEQALKTLPFALPTQCRRYEGRVAIVTGAAQALGLVIARRRSRCCRFSYQTGRVRTVEGAIASAAYGDGLSGKRQRRRSTNWREPVINMCRNPVRTAAFWSPRPPLAKLGVTL